MWDTADSGEFHPLDSGVRCASGGLIRGGQSCTAHHTNTTQSISHIWTHGLLLRCETLWDVSTETDNSPRFPVMVHSATTVTKQHVFAWQLHVLKILFEPCANLQIVVWRMLTVANRWSNDRSWQCILFHHHIDLNTGESTNLVYVYLTIII